MFTTLLKFDWIFFAKKRSFAVMLLFFFLLGLLMASAANFPFADTYKNSPYVITYITGVMSLVCIFSVTILAAQSLHRERDAHFDLILYATPLKKRSYLGSRFMVIFMIAGISFALFMAGLLTGHQMPGGHENDFTQMRLSYYLQPFLVLAVPNILFCTGIICSIGVVSKNKLVIYISGLFIYFLYWGISLYVKSPLMANVSPVSAESLRIMARIDPFGVSAFFEQTQYWTAEQRNSQLIELTGNLLFNRLLYLVISVGCILFAYNRFRFSIANNKTSNRKINKGKPAPGITYGPAITAPKGNRYTFSVFKSYTRLDLLSVFKSIPLWVIIVGWAFFLGMEMVGDISGGTRFPEKFATSGLMIKNIMELFPVTGILILVFYGSELFWRSHGARFEALEKSSPASASVQLVSKWFTLSLIAMLLICSSIVIGIVFQLAAGYPHIDWTLYLSLFYLMGLPLSLCAALVISIQAICNNKYTGLAVAAVLLLLTNTTLGSMVGIKHPLLRFANVFQGNYSEMNGFDIFLDAFHVKMIYWCCITAVIFIVVAWLRGNRNKNAMVAGWKNGLAFRAVFFLACIAGAILSGYVILNKTVIPARGERDNWKQSYEEKYKKFGEYLQPTVTDIRTSIDLFPGDNSYSVSGTYKIVNKGEHDIDSLLIYADKDMKWQNLQVPNAGLLSADTVFGHYWYKLNKPLKPLDTASMSFNFTYGFSGFNTFKQFNAILKNGSFIRISNFFPRFGYVSDNEIDEPRERAIRKMPAAADLKRLEEETTIPYNYGYINLDATISTSGDQAAIGIGELDRQWESNDRNYFHYKTTSAIPFRFAVASANYATRKVLYNGISIEIYFHPGHYENISHLISNAEQALNYCEKNFGKYPYKTIRFVEISSYIKGFAGTAYPTGFFINESFGFQNKAANDPERDMINELVSHELSHTWWGNATLEPEYREGCKLMTETMAMYTELMLYKQVYGEEKILSRVRLHKDIYLAERAQSGEEPLFRADPRKPFLSYDKGMVVMYQLYLLAGEQKINAALRNFLAKYAYPKQPPVASDLLNEFYAVTDTAVHRKIDELFKDIITYDLSLKKAGYTKMNNGEYLLTVEVNAKKYREDKKGNKKEVPFTEQLEAEVYFEDGKKQLLNITVQQNAINITLPQKPERVVLDPRLRLMDINEEDNGKKL